MDKKILKAFIEVIKGAGIQWLDTRPGIKGARLTSHNSIDGKSYFYATNGYTLIRLECGGDGCLPFNDDIFWPLDEMVKEYRTLKNGSRALLAGAIHKSGDSFIYNGSSFDTPNYKQLIDDIEKIEARDDSAANSAAMDLELLKPVANLGRFNIKLLTDGYKKILLARSEGVLFIQLGLKES